MTLALTSARSEIARVVDAVAEFGAANDLTEDDIHSVQLLLDEIVINVVKHGYGGEAGHPIELVLRLDGDDLTIRIEDEARPFDPTQAPPPDLDLPIEQRPIGGLGIHIVRSLVESMDYERTGRRNVLILRKKVRTPGVVH